MQQLSLTGKQNKIWVSFFKFDSVFVAEISAFVLNNCNEDGRDAIAEEKQEEK